MKLYPRLLVTFSRVKYTRQPFSLLQCHFLAQNTNVKTHFANIVRLLASTSEVWRWWEEEHREDGVKWTFLEHKGPMFAPEYEPLPDDVNFYYDGKKMKLSKPAEEVATFYSKMLEHEYTTREVFNKNFMNDWRKTMTASERKRITNLSKCNFSEIAEYFKMKSEERKKRTKEEKQAEKLKNEEIQKEYGFCSLDGHKEKIGNFRIEPPGLFRGRGDNPKQGMLKTRTLPEDVIINCSKDSKVPSPPLGHKWKEVRHDNKVSWLACWKENIQGQTKYVWLNAASKLKGVKDWEKFETARQLHRYIDEIRAQYREDWKAEDLKIQQRAVALYFIDKLALRAGHENKDADTVGCCSLRKEHLKLHRKYNDQDFVVEFDFLGKDFIRYYNLVPVDREVFTKLQLFLKNKSGEDEVFDCLNTTVLNKHLNVLMDGLTAKVFRTYNASRTLQEQLELLTKENDGIAVKLLSYNRANRSVAILCNHQKAPPKNFDTQMDNLHTKIEKKKTAIIEAKKKVKDAKDDHKSMKTERTEKALEKRKTQLSRLEEQLIKLEMQATDKEENKEIALGTSKLNYLDPRISIACYLVHPVFIGGGENLIIMYSGRDHRLSASKLSVANFLT